MDATTIVDSTDTCCTVRLVELSFSMTTHLSARAVIEWVRSSGVTDHRDEIAVSDGPATNPDGTPSTDIANKWLTGSGAGGQPIGLLKALITTPAGEAGTIGVRFKRRALKWFKDNGRLSNNDITLQ